jgi:RNA polymerase primary sigma factor
MNNATRTLRQKGIVEFWAKECGHKGVCTAATGFGKTYLLMLAARLCNLTEPEGSIVVVVPSIPLKDKTEKNIADWGIKNASVYVINTAITLELKCKLLLLDEIHRYNSAEFGKIFETVNYDWVLGVTATLPKEKASNVNKYCPIFDEVPLSECLKNEWVSPFVIANYRMELTGNAKVMYESLQKTYVETFKFFRFDYGLAMGCLTNKKIREDYASAQGFNPSVVYLKAKKFNEVVAARKNFLYENNSKIEAIIEITESLNKKAIIFSLTKAMANRIATAVGGKAYHSGIATKKNAEHLDMFEKGEIKYLSVGKALDEGADIPDIELGIVVANTSSPIQFIQRVGRVIRVSENKRAIIVVLIMKDTQDEKWLKSSQSAATGIIEIDSIEDLKNYA